MRSNTKLYLLALLLVAAGFAYGAASLFIARYTQGDAYPPYSSYRADPLGTRALFESFQALPNVYVARNVEAIDRAGGNRQVTLFVNGLQLDYFSSRELDGELARSLQNVMQRGSRVIIAFTPVADDISDFERLDSAFNERMQERLRRSARDANEKQPEEEQKETQKAEAEPGDEKPQPESNADTTGKGRQESIVNLPSESKDRDETTSKDDESTEDEDPRELQRQELRKL